MPKGRRKKQKGGQLGQLGALMTSLGLSSTANSATPADSAPDQSAEKKSTQNSLKIKIEVDNNMLSKIFENKKTIELTKPDNSWITFSNDKELTLNSSEELTDKPVKITFSDVCLIFF